MTEVVARADHGPAHKAKQGLVVAALGIVYGDIGTSPLYAIKQCFDGVTTVVPERIFGVLSLIAWALFVVVTVKYVLVVMRADNRGEGGILALTALALRSRPAHSRGRGLIMAAGLVGAALFYGDGVITPAISVLSAVEGLKIAAPVLEHYILPITVVLLLILFMMQRHGTSGIGAFFGPVMIVWFAVLGILGAVSIASDWRILYALNPWLGLSFLIGDPWRGFILLGSVVLAVTGAEALYADMGHFGRRPICIAWLRFVFPALLLNYFGQGALLLNNPAAIENPFFLLAPSWALYPFVILASVATIIASQALISGVFSLTRQAVQLGYLPRLEIRHTSESEIGQVFVPRINRILLISVLAVVLGFRTSDNLGAAYGIAVTGTMLITTVLAFLYIKQNLGWKIWVLAPLFALFLIVDLGFLFANLMKIEEGGWFPLVVAILVYVVMSSWRRGRAYVKEIREKDALTLQTFLANLKPDRPPRVPGTAIFMTGNSSLVPAAMLHNMKHNKVLHERNVMMTVRTEDIPQVPEEQRLDIRHLDHNFHTIIVRYGFMEEPNIPRALAQCRVMQFRFNLMETSFFVGRETLVPKSSSFYSRLRNRLFILMSNTMLDATEFFRIPSNRVVELGGQIEI